MRPLSVLLAIGSFIAAASVAAAAAAAPTAAPLPLRKVRLYDTGVGYFERHGKIGAAGEVALPVPLGHLDDALKTLVVIDPGGHASVAGVELPSSVSHNMARRLAGLHADGSDAINYQQLVGSMKGAAVQIRSAGHTVRGRLVDVVPPPSGGQQDCVRHQRAGEAAQTDCTTRHDSTLLMLSDTGELRRFRSSEVEAVRPTEPGWRSRLGSALDALSQRGAQQSRKLRLMAASGKAVTLGYVAETPVWRATYRLVMDKGAGSAVLQGWALLHNDTDEPWRQVAVELVNGRPDSFLFPLAAPRYARRQLVTPERTLSTVPQLLGRTVDNMWSFGEQDAGGLGLSGVGEGGGGRGEGIGLGSIGTIGHGRGVGGSAQSSLLAVGNLAALAKADGVESGALFRYALGQRVDLRARGSALLPFFTAPVAVVRAAYFSAAGVTARAAVRLKNSTKQTWPAGPISLFADGGFAGEAALARTKPGESRILRHGLDLDVELERTTGFSKDEPRVLRMVGDELVEHFVRHHTVSYAISNRSQSARKIYLALDYVQNANVLGAADLEYDSEAGKALAVFDAPAHHSGTVTLEVAEGLSRQHAIAELSAKSLRALGAHASLPRWQREKLAKAAERLALAADSRAAAARRRRQLRQLDADMRRLRANLAAVRGRQGGVVDSMLGHLLRAEKRHLSLERQVTRFSHTAETRRAEARAALAVLNRPPAPKAAKR